MMPAVQNFGSIAVLGEREISLGFRLLGVTNSIIAEGEKGVDKFNELFGSGNFTFIMVSENLKRFMDRRTLDLIETSTVPLVVFVPLPGGGDEESIEKFAKRVLGVDIGR
jgi:V/A-type H+-transporting ATPase subunit F